MAPRLNLQAILRDILESEYVYFQPPANVQLQYPCIIYARDFAVTEFAGNYPYTVTDRYLVTVIDRNPDSAIPGKIAGLPMCTKNRFYTADDLNHDVFNLFF